jgi:hypothetical protein
MAHPKDVLDALTELRRSLVRVTEVVQQDQGLKNYPLLVRDFKEMAGLLRNQVESLQTAVFQAVEVRQEQPARLSRKERLGLVRDNGSW